MKVIQEIEGHEENKKRKKEIIISCTTSIRVCNHQLSLVELILNLT